MPDEQPTVVSLDIDSDAAADPAVRVAMQHLTDALASADLLDNAEVAGFAAIEHFRLAGIRPPTEPASGARRTAPIGAAGPQQICVGFYESGDTTICGINL